MIWRVILFWLLGAQLALANLPKHSWTNGGTRTFVYDAENQLTNVNVAGQWKTEYVYDGLRRKRITRDYTWQGGAWVKTNETRYLYDRMLVIQERDTNNNPLVTYTRGLDLSGSLQRAGGIGGLLARTDANSSTFYHADGAGNITALIDGNQNIVARYEYDGFLRTVGQWGPLGPVNEMRGSSMPNYKGGIIGFWGRFYDPTLQRWLNRDPMGELGGINLYGFVGNSSLNEVDPDGFGHMMVWQDGPDTYVHLVPIDLTPAPPPSTLPLPPAEMGDIYHGAEGIVRALDQQLGSDFEDLFFQDPPPGMKVGMIPFGPGEFIPEAGALEGETAALKGKKGNPVKCPVKKPKLTTNKKHHPNSKSPQPPNVKELYDKSVLDDQGRRWAMDDDGTIHRFSAPSNGESHWNGSTAGDNPILQQNLPPREILQQLK